MGWPLSDPLLTRIYTVDVCSAGDGEKRALVAAGGHGGFISIYGTPLDSVEEDQDEKNGGIHKGVEDDEYDGKDEAIRPLMSWKSSRSWVSGIRFVPLNPMVMVSSSNDGGIVVWDVWKQPVSNSSTSTWSPPIVGRVRELHSSGIYSMDLLKDLIVTGSNDSSLGFCKISDGGGVLIDRIVHGHHCGVIRGVSFRESDILVDCGADRRICVLDMRLPEPCTITVDSDHSNGINTIQWSPAKILNCFSMISEILLPLQKFHGHLEYLPKHQICELTIEKASNCLILEM